MTFWRLMAVATLMVVGWLVYEVHRYVELSRYSFHRSAPHVRVEHATGAREFWTSSGGGRWETIRQRVDRITGQPTPSAGNFFSDILGPMPTATLGFLDKLAHRTPAPQRDRFTPDTPQGDR